MIKYRKPTASQFSLWQMMLGMAWFSCFLALGVHTHWVLAIMSLGVPLAGLGIISVSKRIRDPKQADRALSIGAMTMAVWVTFLMIPSAIWFFYYLSDFLHGNR